MCWRRYGAVFLTKLGQYERAAPRLKSQSRGLPLGRHLAEKGKKWGVKQRLMVCALVPGQGVDWYRVWGMDVSLYLVVDK